MEPTNSQIKAALDELEKNKQDFFCLECGRPRRYQYCPWDAKHPKDIPHRVAPRRNVSKDVQLRLFLSNDKDARTRHVFKG